jgi:lysophospholipase L1-like esterase
VNASQNRHPLLGKTTATLLVMLAALAVPYMAPGLRRLRVVRPPWTADTAPERDETEQPLAATMRAVPSAGEQPLPPSENLPTINNALPAERAPSLPDIDPRVRAALRPVPIEDLSGHSLDAFFTRLARTDRREPGAVTRILYYGDSTIASDYVSGTVRRRLQARFGDAGHGFILVSNPWEWYFHNDVAHASAGEWTASRLAGPLAADGAYGLGGVAFASYGGGVAWFGAATHGEFGRKVGRFDLYYLEQPGGGDVELTVRGGVRERFSTRGNAKVSRVRSLHVDDGEAKLSVRAAGGGPVRLFGVALERDRPGVVCDALGSHGAMAVYWQRQDRTHWKEQMALRDPALIVLQYGTNESELSQMDHEQYERAFSELIDELHVVAEGASVLVVAPLDRAEVRAGKLVTRPIIVDLVAMQRRVALAHGASFWSTFDAMGGKGSMAHWVKARPQMAGADLTHTTPLGAEVLGSMLSDTLVASFDRWERGGS